jgi:hypothetical protein
MFIRDLWISQLLGIILLLAPIVLAALFWHSRRAARRQTTREDGATIEFFVTSGMRLMVTLVLTALFAFTILLLGTVRRNDGRVYALLIPLTVFVVILLLRPVPVSADRNGIRQGRWFLPDKEIAWEDIASVDYGQNTGTTYVRSRRGGPKIRFSAFLVGKGKFKSEIRKHVPDLDFSEDGQDD